MDKEYIPYEQALALKELGFDEPCLAYYHEDGILINYPQMSKNKGLMTILNRCSAPLFSQAFRWFREKYDLFCWIEKFHKDETYIFQIPPANFTKIQGHFKTYEEAELACLNKLIEIVKTNND